MAVRSDTGHLLRLYGGAAARVARRGRRKAASEATDATERPVFVVGAPRSGTTFMGSSLGGLPGFVDLGEVGPLKVAIDDLAALPEDGGCATPPPHARARAPLRPGSPAARGRADTGDRASFWPPRSAPTRRRRSSTWFATAVTSSARCSSRAGSAPIGPEPTTWVTPTESRPLLGRAGARRGVQRRDARRRRAAWAWRRYLTAAQGAAPAATLEVRYEELAADPDATAAGASPGTSTPTRRRWPRRFGRGPLPVSRPLAPRPHRGAGRRRRGRSRPAPARARLLSTCPGCPPS